MTPKGMAALHATVMQHGTPWSAEALASAMTAPGAIVLIDAAGFALGRVVTDEAELLTIAVATERQASGRGKSLLAAFEDEAARNGATQVVLEVASRNETALALYRSAGYVQAGHRPDYYALASGLRDDALILRKSLNI